MRRLLFGRVRAMGRACRLLPLGWLLLPGACRKAEDGEPHAGQPEATGTQLALTTAPASSPAPSAVGTSSDAMDPDTNEPNIKCPKQGKRYWIEIHGDGPVQRLDAGAPPGPKPERNCEPALTNSPAGDVVSACADAAQLRRSCFWANAAGGAYFDRQGHYWKLTTESFPTNAGKTLDAELVLTGKSKQHQEPLRLKVVVHLGRDVVQVNAPDVWGNPDNSLPL